MIIFIIYTLLCNVCSFSLSFFFLSAVASFVFVAFFNIFFLYFYFFFSLPI